MIANDEIAAGEAGAAARPGPFTRRAFLLGSAAGTSADSPGAGSPTGILFYEGGLLSDFRGSIKTEGKFALNPYWGWGWDILAETDCINLLRIQFERQRSAFFPSIREYAHLFGMNGERIRRASLGGITLDPRQQHPKDLPCGSRG